MKMKWRTPGSLGFTLSSYNCILSLPHVFKLVLPTYTTFILIHGFPCAATCFFVLVGYMSTRGTVSFIYLCSVEYVSLR